jgi:hypothetical protein
MSYAQKKRDLTRLTDDYILESNGDIRVVIGLDVEYKGKMAALSLWRPQIRTNDSEEKELMAEQTVTG